MIKTDHYFNILVKPFLPLFKYIHPNYITILGLLINVTILYIRKDKQFIFYFLNILRILCDNLDGMIARKYNKMSYIGGLLDTTGDLTHITVVSYIIFRDLFCFDYFYSFISLFILIGIMYYYMYHLDALSNHNNLYNRSSYRYIDYIPVLISQNTYLSVVFLNIFFIFFDYISFKCSY